MPRTKPTGPSTIGTNTDDILIQETVCFPGGPLIAKYRPEANPNNIALPKKNTSIQMQMKVILLAISEAG
jgi:hypothetical protein